MFLASKAKHAKNSLFKKTTSIGLVGLLIAAGLVATTSASQADPIVEDFYCGEQTVTIETDYQSLTPSIDIVTTAADSSDGRSITTVRFAPDSLTYEILSTLQQDSGVNDLQFANGTFAEIRSLIGGSDIYIEAWLPESLTSEQAWPITITADLGLGRTTDIDNDSAYFSAFVPCVGNIEQGGTTSANPWDSAFSWDDDGFGNIRLLSGGVNYRISAGIEHGGMARKTVQGGNTTFSYVTTRLSDAAEEDVDVVVNVEFSGNTVRWDVEAFETGTNLTVPAPITFYIEGDLGAARPEIGSSNGLTYSTDRLRGGPVLVYAPSTDTTSRIIDHAVRFSNSNVNSGYLEVTLLGYDECATDEEIFAGIDAFTSNYQRNKNQEQPTISGEACASQCQANTQTINRGPGLFDVAGLPLCFETAYDSNDPETLIEQIAPTPGQYDDTDTDIGTRLEEGESVEYLNVVQGSDFTLNAVLTISRLYLQDDDEVDDIDEQQFRNSRNALIDVDLDNEGVFEERYAEFTLTFFVSGDVSRTPVSVSNLSLDVYDIDDYQFFTASGVRTYSFANPTILTARAASDGELRVSENNGEDSDSGDESRVTISFREADSFVLRMGIQSTQDNSSSSFLLDFTGGDAWEEPPVVRPAKPSKGVVAGSNASKPTFVAKRTISRFIPESPKLLSAQRAEIRKFLRNNPELTRITCTGYTAGPVKPSDKTLAKQRATNVCAFIEKIKPAIETKVAGRTPGLPLRPSSRKVVIRGFSVTP